MRKHAEPVKEENYPCQFTFSHILLLLLIGTLNRCQITNVVVAMTVYTQRLSDLASRGQPEFSRSPNQT